MNTIIMIIIIIQSCQSQSGSNTDYLSLCSRFLRSSHDKQIHKIPQQTGCVNQWHTRIRRSCVNLCPSHHRPQQTGHVNQCLLRHKDYSKLAMSTSVHHITGHSKLAMSTRVCYDTKTTTNWLCQPMSIITSLATANWPGQPVSITSLATANRFYRSLQHYNSYCKWPSN